MEENLDEKQQFINSVLECTSGQIDDFRNIENFVIYLVRDGYFADDLVKELTSNEQFQRLGYMTDVAVSIALKYSIDKPQLFELKNKLEKWLKQNNQFLSEVFFTKYKIKIDWNGSLSDKWKVNSNFSLLDFGTKLPLIISGF